MAYRVLKPIRHPSGSVLDEGDLYPLDHPPTAARLIDAGYLAEIEEDEGARPAKGSRKAAAKPE